MSEVIVDVRLVFALFEISRKVVDDHLGSVEARFELHVVHLMLGVVRNGNPIVTDSLAAGWLFCHDRLNRKVGGGLRVSVNHYFNMAGVFNIKL